MHNRPGYQSQMSSSTYDELPERTVGEPYYFNTSKQSCQSPSLNDDSCSTYQLPRENIYVYPISDNTEYSNHIDEHSVYQFPTDETYSISLNPVSNISESNTLVQENTLRPVSSKESFTNEYYSNRNDYSDSFSDATSTSFTESSVHSANQLSLTSSDSGDFRYLQKDTSTEITLSPDDAIAKYRQLQNEITLICNKVLEFVKSKWKSEESLKLNLNSLRQCFVEFYNSLTAIIGFSIGVYQNSLKCSDSHLTKKIGKHVSPLQESKQSVKDALEKLDNMNWEPEKIAISVRLAVREGSDALGQVITAARNVLINTRSLSVTINGNASILFLARPAQLEAAELTNRKTTITTDSAKNVWKLFGQQVKSQVELVNETVDDFIALLSNKNYDSNFKETVSCNSKFVVRTATQLVCIAKNLSDTRIKLMPCDKIEEAGNRLCDCLKSVISITKELIGDRRCIIEEKKDQLLRQLIAVRSNARNVERIVLGAVN